MTAGFFASFPFHREILAPILGALEGEVPCLMSADVNEIIRFQPRVLFISDVYFPRVNGVSTSIRTFRADLAQQGVQTQLVVPRYPHEEPGADPE